MKLFTILAALMVCSVQLFAQAEDMPEAVSATLKAKFATAEDIEWYEMGENFGISFTVNGKDGSAELTSTGTLISSKLEVKKAEMPKQVIDGIIAQYPETPIYDCFKAYNAQFKDYYIATVEMEDFSTATLSVSPAGKILKKELATTVEEGTGDDD